MLIDSLLQDLPVPMLLFQRALVTQTGRRGYSVVDGQQRMRALFDYLDDKFRLTRSTPAEHHNKKFSQLNADDQRSILDYQFVVEELEGYSLKDVIDVFVRMNTYAVKLSKQELRHARGSGKFNEHAERLGRWPWWARHRVFSANQLRRMKATEFAAELTILLLEGPQDKKESVDNYYAKYQSSFPDAARTRRRLRTYLNWISRVMPDIASSRFRKPVDLYALVGAIDVSLGDHQTVSALHVAETRARLESFESSLRAPRGDGLRYLEAASRQTDNLGPRETRIEILSRLIT